MTEFTPKTGLFQPYRNNTFFLSHHHFGEERREKWMKAWWIDEKALTLQQIKAIKMRNVNYLRGQELELMDYN